jgi:uncharacterized cupin superfamily protein
MTTTDLASTTAAVVRPVLVPDAAAIVLPEAHPKAVAPAILESTLVAWTGADPRAAAGVWECSPGQFPSRRDGFDEVCVILSGSATIETSDGHRTELRPGSVVVLPNGWSGTWHVHERLRKSYVTMPHNLETGE